MAGVRRAMTGQRYISGSTVRVEEPYRRVQEPVRQQPERRTSRVVRRNQEKALQMDLPYVIMLTLAALCALYICVGYLQVQSSISGRIHNIELLERDIEQLKSENDALMTRINTDIDLDHVYQVATEELGMVYANRKQVLLYDKTESEYVRQYEDIPKH